MKWMFNCHEVNRMVSAGMDTDLPLLQRMMIRFHMMMCRNCAHIRRQLLSIQSFANHLGEDLDRLEGVLNLSPEARQRIKKQLLKAQAHLSGTTSKAES